MAWWALLLAAGATALAAALLLRLIDLKQLLQIINEK